MPGAFRAAPIVIARAAEPALTLPSAQQVNGMAAEAADQMFMRELLIAAGGRELHADVVVQVKEEARPDDAR